MSGYKLASVAGMAAAAVTSVMQYMDQPGSMQPGSTTPSTQPGTPGTSTTRPGSIPGTTTTQPGTTTRDQSGMRSTERLFMLQTPDSEQRLNDLAQRLQRMESQMQDSSQRLQRQLSQARTLQGDRKTDALADVLQSLVQDHTTMDQYLMDLRMALTGSTSESTTDPRTRRYPSNPSTTPGSPNYPTVPSTPRTPTTPSTPGTTPGTPTTPGGTPTVPR